MNLLGALLELDKLYESVDWADRDILIKDIKAAGKNYNFDKYSDAQLYRIWERIQGEASCPIESEPNIEHDHCEVCGDELTDGGFCPNCDDGRGDLLYEDASYFELGNHITDNYIFPTSIAKYNCILELKKSHSGEVFNREFSDDEIDHIARAYGGKKIELNEDFENKSEYYCATCGHRGTYYDSEVADSCCPKCHEHCGGFTKCEESVKHSIREVKRFSWKHLLKEAISSQELSTEHAMASVVDQVKAVYEAGLFSRLPVGRKNAVTLDIFGPDKDRLVGYFKKQPEFDYEMNNVAGVISHEFISNEYDIEIFDSFISVYKIPQNESVKSVSNTQNINETFDKETNEMNFQTILEELDRLYEELPAVATSKEVAKEKETEKELETDVVESCKKSLAEEADEEIFIDDEPIEDDEAVVNAEEATIETEEAVEEEMPRQVVLECTKCGGIIIKSEVDVTIDDATDLANINEECQYCEVTEGYKIVGEIVPYEGAIVSEENVEEAEEVIAEDETEEEVTETLLEGKIADSIKKIGTRLGADGATVVRSFAELISYLIKNDALLDAAEHVENKAVLKALENGNEKVLNTCTIEDIEELKQDIEEYRKAKADKKAGNDEEDLDEFLDVKVDARGFGGTGNDVSVL